MRTRSMRKRRRNSSSSERPKKRRKIKVIDLTLSSEEDSSEEENFQLPQNSSSQSTPSSRSPKEIIEIEDTDSSEEEEIRESNGTTQVIEIDDDDDDDDEIEIVKVNKTSNSEKQNKKEEENENQECGICFEQIKNKGKIDSCKHQFCFSCINKWSKSANTCPICRERFNFIKKVNMKEINKPKKKKRGKRVKSKVVRVPNRNFQPSHDSSLNTELIQEILRRRNHQRAVASRIHRPRVPSYSLTPRPAIPGFNLFGYRNVPERNPLLEFFESIGLGNQQPHIIRDDDDDSSDSPTVIDLTEQ